MAHTRSNSLEYERTNAEDSFRPYTNMIWDQRRLSKQHTVATSCWLKCCTAFAVLIAMLFGLTAGYTLGSVYPFKDFIYRHCPAPESTHKMTTHGATKTSLTTDDAPNPTYTSPRRKQNSTSPPSVTCPPPTCPPCLTCPPPRTCTPSTTSSSSLATTVSYLPQTYPPPTTNLPQYIRGSKQSNWARAKADCMKQSRRLTMTRNMTEYNGLLGFLNKTDKVWIGLSSVESKWLWLDGSELDPQSEIYNKANRKELLNAPNGTAYCTILEANSSNWVPKLCDDEYSYVCGVH